MGIFRPGVDAQPMIFETSKSRMYMYNLSTVYSDVNVNLCHPKKKKKKKVRLV